MIPELNPVLKIARNCTGCGRCLPACPTSALTLETEQPHGQGRKQAVVDPTLCWSCAACLPSCPRDSLTLESPD